MTKKSIGIGAVIIVVIIIAVLIGVGATTQQDSSTYKVTYDANGGTVHGGSQWTANEKEFVELDASKNGYLLDGWYKNKEGTGDKVTNGTKITSDTTVYAKWTPNFKLSITEKSSPTYTTSFEIITKTGAKSLIGTYFDLPDSGTTKIISTSGTNFTVIKDVENNDCLRFKNNDTYYYLVIKFTDAKTVNVGVDGTGHGYFEFSYDKNISITFHENAMIVEYNSGDGHFGTEPTEKEKGVTDSITYVSDTSLSLVPPAGEVFDGWYTSSTGGNKVEVGSTIVPNTNAIVIKVYAHYITEP